MMPIGEGSLTPFGLEYVLILATLTVVGIMSCDVPIAFEIRRHIMRSARWAEAMKGFIDVLVDACRRTARRVGDLAARMTTPSPPATLALKSGLNPNLGRHS